MTAKMNTILRNQSGAALVIALIMIIVITLIALASSYTSIFEIKISGNKRGSADAFYGADAGINEITSYPTQSFNMANYPPILVPNTSSTYNNPFNNLPNPIPISAAGSITYFSNQSGPPRGGGYSALNVSYAYFQVQCAGSDSAGSGAQATVQEDVIELIPVAQ